MTEKLLIIIASGDREKVLTALMYAKNNIKYGWIPSENLLVSDSDVTSSAMELANLSQPLACQLLSDRDNISERIERMGVEVDYVGTIIADFLRDGYTPMVW
jgi:hypothetical protein